MTVALTVRSAARPFLCVNFSGFSVYRRLSKNLVVMLTNLFLLSGLSTSAIASPLPVTDKTARMIGIAATVPESTRRVLIGMVSYCSQFGVKSTDAFTGAFSTWLLRHQEYLAESARVKEDLIALVKQTGNPPTYLKEIEQMYMVGIPKMVAAKIARNTNSIDVLPNADAKASRCMADAKMINDGLWDLKVNHADAARFLEERFLIRKK
ncbi:hypothetical protein HUX88_20665 [Duganella sp. BJB1802]|uniref:hypothetical protein n=1 Tax=Duganella sp. BJB1802 TaxID=2744575 RepID=UPI001594D969|nr:hypothetical protein [Duganella sp. BJB1802]NVD72940.1 hypothetical protein [Duganella sp. BJB1802]